jgi:hypothetical protein
MIGNEPICCSIGAVPAISKAFHEPVRHDLRTPDLLRINEEKINCGAINCVIKSKKQETVRERGALLVQPKEI